MDTVKLIYKKDGNVVRHWKNNQICGLNTESGELVWLTEVSQCDNDVGSKSSKSNFSFTHVTILILLKLVLQNKDKFRDKTVKKETLWRELAENFNKMGYLVSGSELDKKFRNLKQTYVKLKEKNGKTLKGKTNWSYYNIFEEIFADKVSTNVTSVLDFVSHTDEIDDETNTSQDKIDLNEVNQSKNSSIGIMTSTTTQTSAPSTLSKSSRTSDEYNSCRKKQRLNDPPWAVEIISLQKQLGETLEDLKNILKENNVIQIKRNTILEKFLELQK